MKVHCCLITVISGFLVLWVCSLPLPATAAGEEPAGTVAKEDQPPKESVDAALQLLKIKGSRQQAIKACLGELDQQRSTNPALTRSLYLALKEEMTSDENIDAFILLIAHNFAKRFTVEELNELSVFYGSPIGKRVASEEAGLALEGMETGRQWGMKIGQKVEKALQKNRDLR